MDVLGLGALGLVGAEWLALGWLGNIAWPRPSSTFWPARWALRLLGGQVLLAMTELLLALVGAGFASLPVVLVVAALGALAVRLIGQGRRSEAVGARQAAVARAPFDVGERLGWMVLAAVLLGATVRSMLVPEAGWDAYSHWGLRAQAYALAGRVVNAGSEHDYYPPLVPLLEAWLYLHRGAVSIDLAKTLWAVTGSAFAVCLGWHLRLSLHQPWLAPWLATGIVLVSPALLDGFFTGQADLALTAYVTLAALSLVHWSRVADRSWARQAALFAAAAGLTKLEGAPRMAVIVLALAGEAVLGWRSRGWHPARPLTLALVMGSATAAAVLVWTAAAAGGGISSNSEHLGPFQPAALGSVALALVAVFGGIRTGGGLIVAGATWLLGA